MDVSFSRECDSGWQTSLKFRDLTCARVQFFFWAMSVTWTVYAYLGATRYAPLSHARQTQTIKVNWISQVWCIMSLMTSKIAVAALIARLQSPCRWRTNLLWVVSAINVAWSVSEIIILFTQCRPLSKIFDHPLKARASMRESSHPMLKHALVSNMVAELSSPRLTSLLHSILGFSGLASGRTSNSDDLEVTAATSQKDFCMLFDGYRYLVSHVSGIQMLRTTVREC